MTITFNSDKDVIVYALEKIISFIRDNQYLFVANCVWWISGIIGLTDSLVTFIDNLEIRREIGLRGISSEPRDIARNIIDQSASNLPSISDEEYCGDPLRQTGQGHINPLPQSKRQLKKARQAKARRLRQQANTNTELAKIREKIISNLRLE